MDLSFSFKPNGTYHGDMVLRLAGKEWICDSYYFVIDSVLLPEVEDEAKVRAVLRRLLEQWLAALSNLKTQDVAYLPFDFSDQCTGWLQCTRTESGFSVVSGWSSVEGWSFSPSKVGMLHSQLTDFRADGPVLEVDAFEMFAAVRNSAGAAEGI